MCCRNECAYKWVVSTTFDTHNSNNNHAYTPLNHFCLIYLFLAFPPRCCISAFVLLSLPLFISCHRTNGPALEFVLVSNLKCSFINIDFWNSAGARCKMHNTFWKIDKSFRERKKRLPNVVRCVLVRFWCVCVSPPYLAITRISKIEITTLTASSYIFRK